MSFQISPNVLKVLRPFCRARPVFTSRGLDTNEIRNHVSHGTFVRPASRLTKPPEVKINKRQPRLLTTDVPPLGFWQGQARNLQIDDPMPEKSYKLAHKFVDASNSPSKGWIQRLEHEQGITSFDLYSMGLMIINGPVSPAWSIGFKMLGTSSELGLDAATLTVIKLGFQANRLGRLGYRVHEQAFSKLLLRRDDPNAMTLQGQISASKGHDDLALKWFNDAERVAGSSDWDWKVDCLFGKGKVLLRKGQVQEAQRIFKLAAIDLDDAGSYYELGMLQEEGSEEQLKYLNKAAISGLEVACRALAEINLSRAKTASGGKAKYHETLASEWFTISGDKSAPL